ncbi:MAG: c-type cytochrome [Xanthomonadales bacterium]|nr:c-type cytochrome [Xanthomonadales bacterium]
MLRVLLAAGLAMFVVGNADAADAAAGKAKSAMCAACHGADGKSKVPHYPHLAGQQEQYLLLQLKNFKSGERPNQIMGPMTQGLSDADIANLAAYYASLGN